METTFIHKRSVQVGNIEKNSRKTGAQVFIFPARTSGFDGNPVYYLFSVRQVVEVLRHVDVQAVPFGPKYAEGVAEWRGHVLPILSLEKCLGLQESNEQMPRRTIVVRSVAENSNGNFHESYAIVKVGAAVHQLALPLACEPVDVPHWVTETACLSGVYQMQERFLLVVNVEKILNA